MTTVTNSRQKGLHSFNSSSLMFSKKTRVSLSALQNAACPEGKFCSRWTLLMETYPLQRRRNWFFSYDSDSSHCRAPPRWSEQGSSRVRVKQPLRRWAVAQVEEPQLWVAIHSPDSTENPPVAFPSSSHRLLLLIKTLKNGAEARVQLTVPGPDKATLILAKEFSNTDNLNQKEL